MISQLVGCAAARNRYSVSAGTRTCTAEPLANSYRNTRGFGRRQALAARLPEAHRTWPGPVVIAVLPSSLTLATAFAEPVLLKALNSA